MSASLIEGRRVIGIFLAVHPLNKLWIERGVTELNGRGIEPLIEFRKKLINSDVFITSLPGTTQWNTAIKMGIHIHFIDWTGQRFTPSPYVHLFSEKGDDKVFALLYQVIASVNGLSPKLP